MKVTKRNKNVVDFDQHKITIAILSALNETKEGNYEIAFDISNKVVENIIDELTSVESIQDLIEKTLMNEGYFKTAKNFILYREEHKQQREFEIDLMKRIAKLSKETDRDNANIGHSPASKMYQIGSIASKAFYTNKLLPKQFAKLYSDGDLHIHDFDYYDKTFNCLSIPLERMLKDLINYEFEYGSVRSPKRLLSAMSLASIILQRISNDIFGGTLLGNLDITIQSLVTEGYIEIPDEAEMEQSAQSLLYNLATMPTRAGNQIPFSSITFGLETGEYGRGFTKAILNEFKKGMGRGETFIFPNLIFKCLSGVSFQESDKNYDLYDLAVEVSCARMNPTFNFLDCDYYKMYDPKEVNVMGCRTHVIANINGDSISDGRGNIFPTTINLPRLALKSKGINFNKDVKDFYRKLDKMLENVKELSMHRYNILANLKASDIPYVMCQGVYYKSENLNPNDKIESALKQGTIAIGFLGIAEAVKELIGTHHGESNDALQLALEINEYIRNTCDEYTNETGLNWSCYATPAESTCGKVMKDRQDFGTIEGVTDKDYYTNSFHIPVYFPISIARKLTIEGLFHTYNNGGRISYYELSAPPIHNTEGVKEVHKHMVKSNIGYGAANFPIDECVKGDYSGVIKDTCPKCKGTNIKKIRRVSGYLGFQERINPNKSAEIKDRYTHDNKE